MVSLYYVVQEMHSFSMKPAKYFYDKPLPKYLDPKTVLIYRPHPVYIFHACCVYVQKCLRNHQDNEKCLLMEASLYKIHENLRDRKSPSWAPLREQIGILIFFLHHRKIMLSVQSKCMQPSHISTILLKKILILCFTYFVRTGIENQSTYLSLYDANI